MADAPEPRQPPQDWIDALDRSKADAAAGRTVPWSEARERLLANLKKLEAEQAISQA